MDLSKEYIPKGDYCYDKSGLCPYWSLDDSKPYQHNGYCSFLGRGDWDLNEEKTYQRIYKDGTKGELQSANEIGLPMSLLWDQCKECGENMGGSDYE